MLQCVWQCVAVCCSVLQASQEIEPRSPLLTTYCCCVAVRVAVCVAECVLQYVAVCVAVCVKERVAVRHGRVMR